VSLETHFNNVIGHLISTNLNCSITTSQLIQSIDLTLLDENPSQEALNKLIHLAETNEVAAVCVFAKHLHFFTSKAQYNLATVINFPQGTNDLMPCIMDIKQAITLGAKEIDYVLPYQMYLADNKLLALNQCNAIAQLCKKNGLILKIILETGVFPDMRSIYEMSSELLLIGCDFLKTSTGKINQGASLSSAFAILSAIKDSGKKCGVKFSGGVKTPQQALNYAFLAELVMEQQISKDWFRLGASSLLEELLLSK
jgi:deoxyribose-phosphate aldolase